MHRCVTLILTGLLAATTAAGADDPVFRAGAHAQDVTPETFPVSVNGGFQDRHATKATDRLHARCLVLDDGKIRLALVVVDSCMLPRELVDEAKQLAAKATGIPVGNMLVSATHTHSAPTATGVFQSEPDAGYVRFLTRKIADGIITAHAKLAPAEIGWGVTQEPSELFNRRWRMKPGGITPDPFGNTTDRVKMNPGHQNPNLLEPAGPTDPDVTVLGVRTLDGRPLAVFANYSLHYVGDLPPLSADYFGVFADSIAAKVGGKEGEFVGILSNGTSGDVNNVNFQQAATKSGPGERCRKVAETVATAAKKAYDAIRFTRTATLAAASAELELKVRKPSAAELKRADAILEQAGDRVLTKPEQVYARETRLIDRYPDTVKLMVQAFRIGDLGVAQIPCETFTEIGLEVKRRSPLKPTCTVSLANGYNGYLPTPAQHALGGYETWRARSSYLEVNASEVITAEVLKLLTAVAEGK